MSYFITGTDTGVGKTHTAVQILRLLRASGASCAAMKPICCGDREDAKLLLGASDDGFTIEDLNPVWLKTPAAPLAASMAENVNIDIGHIVDAFQALRQRVQHVIVEGVGGWLVPILPDYFVSNLAAELRLPVVIVVQNKLGCLNHTALTVRSVQDHGLVVAGMVLNKTPEGQDVALSTNGQLLASMFPDTRLLPELGSELRGFPAAWRPLFA